VDDFALSKRSCSGEVVDPVPISTRPRRDEPQQRRAPDPLSGHYACMVSRVGRRTIALLLCLIAPLATGCSGRSTGATPVSTSAETTKDYALLDDPAWTLKSAVDPPANGPMASIERPPLDWYDEYEHLSGKPAPGVRVIGQAVRISRHATNLARSQALLAAQGFKSQGVDVKGWRAVQLSNPNDPTPEALILLDRGTSVLMVLSYELTVKELARLASTIKLVDRSDWIGAGGVVQ
jgi:hypothetical protein